MKKLIAFMFAAAVAVGAFGEGASAPESWYTPDGWEKRTVEGGYSDKSKSYPVIVKLGKDKQLNAVWGDPKPTNDGIVYAVESALKAQWKAENASDSVKKLADTVYNQGAMSFKADGNGVVHVYAKDATGKDVDKGVFPQLGYKFEAVRKKEGLTGCVSLTYNGEFVGPKSCPVVVQPDNASSIQDEYNSNDDTWYHEILGWDNPSSHHALDNLTASMQANPKGVAQNYQLVARSSTGGLNYVDLGTLTTAGGASLPPDEKTIVTNATGNTGKLALYGFHGEDTETGAIPARGTDGKLAWVNPDGTDGALLVSQTGDKPKYTAKSERNYYYGTSKPADPGDVVLGWHELPNVTTNYVEGDERTITAETTTDPGTGETCKKLKLTAEPRGGMGTENLLFGAKMVNDELKWEPVSGGYVAPLIADNVTITNADNKLALTGFASATDGQFLARKSATEVEWKDAAVEATAGLESAGELIGIQNYMMTPTATFADRCGAENYSVFARKRTDSPTGSTYSVEFVSMSQTDLIDDKSISTNAVGEMCIKGYESAQRTGAIPCKYGNSVHWTEPEAQWANRYYGTSDETDVHGNYTVGWRELPGATPEVHGNGDITVTNSETAAYITIAQSGNIYGSWVNGVDAYGKLTYAAIDPVVTNVIDGYVTADYITNEVNDIYVLKTGDTMSGDLEVNASVTANEVGALYAAFNDAEMNTCDITNLTAVMSAELPAATTIDGKSAVLVDDPPEGQPKIKSMKIENGKLVIIDADGVSHYFTQDPITP